MKKKYAIKFKQSFSGDRLIVAIFIGSVIAGTAYALLTRGEKDAIFMLLNNYFLSEEGVHIKSNVFLQIAYRYFKQLILIWLLGFFGLTLPLSMLAFFGIVFAYSFTTTYLLLGYGIQGLLIGLLAYGLQSIVIVSIAMYLSMENLRKNSSRLTHDYSHYAFGIVPISVGVCVASLADVMILSQFNFITRFLL